MSEQIQVFIGGENVSVTVDGGNVSAGADLNLAELQQAVQDAETAATEAENAAQQAEAARDDTINGLAAKANKDGSDITSASDWRTALSLGNSAVLDVGTVAGTVAAGDDSRILGAVQKNQNLDDLGDKDASRVNIGVAEFASKALAESTTVTSIMTHIRTAGFATAGDGGNALYARAASEPSHPGKFQTADGAWWEMVDAQVSAFAFGLSLSPSADNTSAINNALLFSSVTGAVILQPVGTAFHAGELVVPGGARWRGILFQSIVKKSVGSTGRSLISQNFDLLTGTTDGYSPLIPNWFEVDGITLDGNYMQSDRSSYINTTGGGVFFFARRYKIRAIIQNMAGKGFYSECPSGNPSPLVLGFSPEADIKLRVDTTKEEGVVWKGPGDVIVDHILQLNAGARIASEQMSGKVSSPTYGSENGGYTDGLVFETGCEVRDIHSFGNFAGGGIYVKGGRFNASFIMAESCHFGGIHLVGGYGQIDRLEVHRVGGFLADTRPDIFYNSPGQGNVGYRINQVSNNNISYDLSRGPCNRMVVGSSSRYLSVSQFDIRGGGRTGHGLVVEDGASFISMRGGEVSHTSGVADDGDESTAVYRKAGALSTGATLDIEANVIDCPVALRTTGSAHRERLKIGFQLNTGQVAFMGDVRTLSGQDWDISGTIGPGDGSNNWYGSKWYGVHTFNSTIATEQSANVTHRLIAAPGFGRIQCSVRDVGTSVLVPIERTLIGGYTTSTITIKYKQASAEAVDSQPQVWITAEI